MKARSVTRRLKPDERHPINVALGCIPKTDTPERTLYRRLINRFDSDLDSQEKRDFVAAMISARGDYIGAVYAGGIVPQDAPIATAQRAARRLAADPHVAACLRDAFALPQTLPTKGEIIQGLGAMLHSSDSTERTRAVQMLTDFCPELRPTEDEQAELRMLLKASNLHPVIELAKSIGALQPEAMISETNGDTRSEAAKRGERSGGWREGADIDAIKAAAKAKREAEQAEDE